MSAPARGVRFRRSAAVVAAAGFMLAAAGALRAAEPPAEPRFSLAVAAGGFLASDSAVSKVYPSLGIPVQVRVGWRFAGPWTLFAGFRFLRMSGTTVIVGTAIDAESYAVRLTVSAWQAGFRWQAKAGRWTFRLEAGASRFAYEEAWTGAAFDVKGTSFGGFGGGGVEWALTPWLAAAGGLEYGILPTRSGGRLAGKPDLGGMDGMFGLILRF